MSWKWLCKVPFQGVVEGTPSDINARWEWSHKMDARWKWSHEVTFQGVVGGPHLICMPGGNAHVRWTQGVNGHMR